MYFSIIFFLVFILLRHPVLQNLGTMKQARTQETIYNPSFFADANQQNGSVHEVQATLH